MLTKTSPKCQTGKAEQRESPSLGFGIFTQAVAYVKHTHARPIRNLKPEA